MNRILLLAGCFVFGMNAYAQEQGTNDLSFGAGIGTSNDFLAATEEIISNLGGVTTTNQTSGPSLNVTYKTAIKNNWFFYADGTFQTITEDVVENSVVTGDVSHRYITFGFGTEYHYIHSDWLQMYSGGSIAYTSNYSDFTTSSNLEDTSDGYFNFQVNAVGLRIGKSLAGFVELGVGYKGFANAGLSFQF